MTTTASAPAVSSRGATAPPSPPSTSIPPRVHDLIDYIRDCAYANGYRDGVRDAGKAMDAAIAEAAAPLPASAKAVIDSLLRHWNRGTT